MHPPSRRPLRRKLDFSTFPRINKVLSCSLFVPPRPLGVSGVSQLSVITLCMQLSSTSSTSFC